MRYFRLLLGLLCLLGFASMASGVTNINVTSTQSFDVLPDGNRYLLGTATVGQATTVNLTLANVSGQAERVTASGVASDGVTAGGTIVTTGTGITGGTTVSPGTAAEFSVTGPTKGTINLSSTSNGLEASFSGTGEAIAIGGTINLTLSVKPLVAGNLTVLISFSQIVTGDDGYFYFTLTAVSPPATPAPAKPIPDKPGIDWSKGAETVGADGSVSVRFLIDWRVIQPAKIKWDFGDGTKAEQANPNAMPAHIYTQAGTYKVRLEATDSKTGEVKVAERVEVFPTPPPSDPVAVFDPGSSGYHPQPKGQGINQASGLVKTTRRAKPAAMKSRSWGEIKNGEQ